MTIEQKALKLWGATSDPAAMLYILADGTTLNGMTEKAHTRTVDHAEIGQFFKRSKFEQPGSNYLYIKKFIRRGNIRASASNTTLYFQLYRPPTKEQWRAMGRCFVYARKYDLRIEIERMPRTLSSYGNKLYNRDSYIAYLARYVPSLNAA